MSHPSPFSSLASKPPQTPSTTSTNASSPPPTSPTNPESAHSPRPPPLRSPSSNNYAAALADAKARAAQSPTSPGIYKPLGTLGRALNAPNTASSTSNNPSATPAAHATSTTPTLNPSFPSPAADAQTSGPSALPTSPANAPAPVKLTTSTGKYTGTIAPPAGMVVDGAGGPGGVEGEGNGGGGGRGGVERMQSWSEQDMKRVMQERLLRGEGAGFSKGGRR